MRQHASQQMSCLSYRSLHTGVITLPSETLRLAVGNQHAHIFPHVSTLYSSVVYLIIGLSALPCSWQYLPLMYDIMFHMFNEQQLIQKKCLSLKGIEHCNV